MASSSSFLLAMAALAALFAVGLCGNSVTLTVGKGTTPTYTHLVLVANLPIHELAIREKGAAEFLDDMKESPAKTFTQDSKAPLKGPLSVRFAVKGGGYRNRDEIFPVGLKPGAVINTNIPY
ncbi:hypothetical protein BDA96_05G236200 [Sorghum bicolor]|uniref:Expansin-like CBD domain-containing protein n=2 Tax=Sorghum bicolor TaxID=4558 RepID=A0A921QZ46_SORBI|nr:expansin-B11 [Sorghum bicolor]EES10282.1 hypothetical protein SORBI_3005G220500 [Sorghum bicolor]KAG0530999.1 hypothetical protein BDA96_05G236200 [Sorghum bicolor]|eukprot:XP_002451294.1 expansin-B11 [Sorghum bicolor]